MEKDLTITRHEKERKEGPMANMQDVAKLANVSRDYRLTSDQQ